MRVFGPRNSAYAFWTTTDTHIYITRNLDWTPLYGARFARPIMLCWFPVIILFILPAALLMHITCVASWCNATFVSWKKQKTTCLNPCTLLGLKQTPSQCYRNHNSQVTIDSAGKKHITIVERQSITVLLFFSKSFYMCDIAISHKWRNGLWLNKNRCRKTKPT